MHSQQHTFRTIPTHPLNTLSRSDHRSLRAPWQEAVSPPSCPCGGVAVSCTPPPLTRSSRYTRNTLISPPPYPRYPPMAAHQALVLVRQRSHRDKDSVRHRTDASRRRREQSPASGRKKARVGVGARLQRRVTTWTMTLICRPSSIPLALLLVLPPPLFRPWLCLCNLRRNHHHLHHRPSRRRQKWWSSQPLPLPSHRLPPRRLAVPSRDPPFCGPGLGRVGLMSRV